jgi:2-methylcitrate dehydratase PrpD
MVIETRYEDVPIDVIELAKQAIFDTLSVLIAGSNWEVSPAIVAQIADWGGKPESPVLVHGHRVPAPLAAFANGVMARGIDMGDVHELAGHVTEWNVPAMLAVLGLAGRPISGREFLVAYLAGAELSVRACAAVNLPNNITKGIPGEFNGSLCAAASVARLLGLSVEQTWNALGICYSVHSLSESQKYAEGSQMVRVQHGFAAETAVKAVLLTRLGITGPKGIFTASPGGMLRHLHLEGLDPGCLTRDLGTRWIFADGLSMKPYAGCKFTHSFIAGTIELMQRHDIDFRQIASIDCVGSEGARLCTVPKETKWNPRTTSECLFSAPYAIATAAIGGDVFLPDFSEAERSRQDKRDLMARIAITHDPRIVEEFEGYSVAIRLADGRRFEQVTPYVKGHTRNRMSWADLEAKYRKCLPYAAVPIGAARAARLLALCRHLEEVPDVLALVQALVP